MARTSSKATVAVGYCRVSTTEQAAEGVSLEAQAAQVRAYCTLRGLELLELVTDAGVSGGVPLEDRDGGRRVLDLVRSRKVGAVVALKLDRVFRSAADCLTVTAGWDRAGVSLHLLDIGGSTLDTGSAMGRFFLTVMAGAAELERNLIGERTKTAMQHKAGKGERVGAVPFGKRLAEDGRTLEDDPAEQTMLGLVRAYRAEGLSIRAVAERLNAEGRPARGSRWHATTVARVLKGVA